MNGSVVSWGRVFEDGRVAEQLSSGVVSIHSNGAAFVAVKEGGQVVTWGDQQVGGNSSLVADHLASGVSISSSSPRELGLVMQSHLFGAFCDVMS